MKRRTKNGIILLCISFAGLLFAHSHFCYNTIYRPTYLFSKAVEQKPLDAIIVPGIPFDGLKWGFVMKWRVFWSVFLYRTGVAKNIIYSGGAVYTPYTESMIMALYAEKLGIPREHIFIETNAEHTTENLYYSWQLAKEKGFKKIAFATDPFQSLQIAPYIPKFDIDVTLLPSVIYFMEHMPVVTDPEIESYKAYKLNFVSIRERETPAQQLFYSRGGRIKMLLDKKQK
ncbi:MAG: hypothetical protein K0Q95_3109 [Bacteroidota bacterium]|jgi:uncharacterized SAM-binding protein YcdF (DUF218 family)|nr:hypothetical protein [Bacteroidota bacterium]